MQYSDSGSVGLALYEPLTGKLVQTVGLWKAAQGISLPVSGSYSARPTEPESEYCISQYVPDCADVFSSPSFHGAPAAL